jgi:hypothetical protein
MASDHIIKGAHNRAFFVFGRFQPPTRGHELLFNELASKAAAEGADAYVFVTSTQDNKKNPLSVEQKIAYIREMFPDERRIKFINTTEMDCKTISKAAHALIDAGYTDLEIFAGSDRYDDYAKIASDYRDLLIKKVHKLERDPDAEGATAESGTKVRAAAVNGDIERVRNGLPASTRGTTLAERLSANIISGLAGSKTHKKRARSKGGYRRTRRAPKKLTVAKRRY